MKVAQSCPTLLRLTPYSPWNSPGQNTGVRSLSLLQGIFLTQESNQGFLHCRWILYQLSYQGSPFSCVQLSVIPWTVTCHAPLSMGFPRQENWSGLPFLPPVDLPDLGIKPVFPALAGRFFTTEPFGKPYIHFLHILFQVITKF